LDAYNANPTSMEAALRNFAAMNANGKEKIAILGEMAELGQQSHEEHIAIFNLIEKLSINQSFLVGKEYDSNPAGCHSLTFKTVEDAIDHVRQLKLKNSYILIKGSRSAKMEKVLEGL